MGAEHEAFASLAAGLHFDRSKQPRKAPPRPEEEGLLDNREASHNLAGPSGREPHTRDAFEVVAASP